MVYPETVHWFTIGEAMQSGSMYYDIWDALAPFSATVYMVVTWLFGRSVLALLIIGSVLTFIQALIINAFSINAKLFENNSNLPALVFVLLTSTSPAFFTLSPALLGLTFILLGLGKLLSHVEFRAKKDMHIIMIGLYFGVAPLFFLPYIVIIPISLILLGLFSNTVLRRYLLLLFSSATPLLISFFYYWVISDHPGYFIDNFILFNNKDAFYHSISWLERIEILSFSMFFLVLGILSFGKQRRLTNYQNRIMQLFVVLGILLTFILFLEKPVTPYGLVFILPVAAFFTTHFISLFKKRVFSLILSILLFLGPTALLWSYSTKFIDIASVKVNSLTKSKYLTSVKGKKIMVLGSAKNVYDEAKLAGPFYDWGLSKQFFTELDYYDNLIFLQNHIEASMPEIIIDLENNWPKISKRLPQISKRYHQVEPTIWVLKTNTIK